MKKSVRYLRTLNLVSHNCVWIRREAKMARMRAMVKHIAHVCSEMHLIRCMHARLTSRIVPLSLSVNHLVTLGSVFVFGLSFRLRLELLLRSPWGEESGGHFIAFNWSAFLDITHIARWKFTWGTMIMKLVAMMKTTVSTTAANDGRWSWYEWPWLQLQGMTIMITIMMMITLEPFHVPSLGRIHIFV